MVLRVEAVESRLLRLEEVLTELEELGEIPAEMLRSNLRDSWAVERGLQVGAEIVFDISNHILSGHFGISAESYEDMLVQLTNRGVLDADLHGRLKGLGGFRNLLVHDYLRIDPEKVAKALVRAPRDFGDFARAIRGWLRR